VANDDAAEEDTAGADGVDALGAEYEELVIPDEPPMWTVAGAEELPIR
jgi:hypothetical protein